MSDEKRSDDWDVNIYYFRVQLRGLNQVAVKGESHSFNLCTFLSHLLLMLL